MKMVKSPWCLCFGAFFIWCFLSSPVLYSFMSTRAKGDALEVSISAHHLSIITYFYSTKALFYHSRWNLSSTSSLLPIQEMCLLWEGTEFFTSYKLNCFLFYFCNIFILVTPGLHCPPWTWSSGTMTPGRRCTLQPLRVQHFSLSLIKGQGPVVSASLVYIISVGIWLSNGW